MPIENVIEILSGKRYIKGENTKRRMSNERDSVFNPYLTVLHNGERVSFTKRREL
jgi:hypothetical protein